MAKPPLFPACCFSSAFPIYFTVMPEGMRMRTPYLSFYSPLQCSLCCRYRSIRIIFTSAASCFRSLSLQKAGMHWFYWQLAAFILYFPGCGENFGLKIIYYFWPVLLAPSFCGRWCATNMTAWIFLGRCSGWMSQNALQNPRTPIRLIPFLPDIFSAANLSLLPQP